jgi:protein associated with RNAse G/E
MEEVLSSLTIHQFNSSTINYSLPSSSFMSDFTVHKLDENGHLVLSYPAKVLERSNNHVSLEAFFSRDDMDLGYATFKKGDRFVEYFYTDRWYNVFAIYDRDDGVFKGWYCNICRPSVVTETAVSCEDLALDIWVTPQGHTTILDEEEFTALSIPKAEAEAAQQAVNALQLAATNQTLPN